MKVTYLDHMGTDLTVVNAARVSFGKESGWEWWNECEGCASSKECFCLAQRLSAADQSLIAFLARGCTSGEWEKLIAEVSGYGAASHATRFHQDAHEVNKAELVSLLHHIRQMPPHWTPFGHCQITLHLKVPISVARQIMKHQVGFVVNEVSRRYVDDTPEMFHPPLRLRAENVKQGSSDQVLNDSRCDDARRELVESAIHLYETMIEHGVAPEVARFYLPQGGYTEFWMTGSLFGWANLVNQRSAPHAQRETQEVARQIAEIVEPLFPVSWKELTR